MTKPRFVTSRPHRYRTLAATLADALRAGRYPPGTRLPSVRHLCEEHGASLATVTHALHELEDAGLIEARPRRGFYARQVPLPATSSAATVALELEGRRKRLMALAAFQPDCLSLGHLALPAQLLPLTVLRRLVTRQLSADASPLATGSVFGADALREQLARRAPRMGCAFSADDIVVTQGQSESLQLCLQLLTHPGDVVVVSSPAPMRALELITSMGLRALEIPSAAEGGLSLAALSTAVRQQRIAACVIETDHPWAAGSPWTDASKQALVALLGEHRLPLIECDMMGELHRGAYRPRPLKAFDNDDWVLYCGSFACITGPGFSVGYIVNGRHRFQLRAARAVHGELIPSLAEQALADFLASGSFDAHLRRLRLRLKNQVDAYRRAVMRHFPAGTQVTTSESGYALWVELPHGLDALGLLHQARERGYTFVPGAVFSMGKQFDHCLRLTAGHPMDEDRATGIRTLGEIAQALVGSGENSLAQRSPAATRR